MIKDTDNKEVFMNKEEYKYFGKSKQSLFLFRNIKSKYIDIKHQRACDSLFTIRERKESNNFTQNIIVYSLLEVLLNKNTVFVELFAQDEHLRKKWIKLIDS